MISCGKVPQTDIDAANAAIDSAKTVGADQYLPDEFMAVQDSLRSALEAIEKAKSKMLFRNYSDASNMLQNVKAMADQTIANTEIKKTQVREEVQSALAEVDSLVAENKVLIVKAPKGKEGKAALDAINVELSAVATAAAEAKTLFDTGNFIGAKEKIMAAKDKAVSINAELKEAIAKVKGKK